ncbi:BC1872 family protein [Paenibacillus koleovorans]|uniref:BC1872 family protein n=1 Tax=Paenibacillus koleovorans TaxID=121608 RepID=UPI000FDB2354|nr:hypothetical protein [Paenibacillus koleovorans]
MLTREQIMAMKPGPEMDQIVNKKLFGFTVRAHRDIAKLGLPFDRSDFLPSSFLPNAWEVVKKVHETIGPMILSNNDYRGWYSCGFYLDDVTIVETEAETAPLAICRAFLLADLERSERQSEEIEEQD